MTYEFSMEKKTVAKLVAGLTVVGALLFTAGLLVGLQWSQGRSNTTNVAETTSAPDEKSAEKGTAKDQEISQAAVTEPEPEPVTPAAEQQGSSATAGSPANAQANPPQPLPAAEPPATQAGGNASPAQEKPQTALRQVAQPNYSVSVSPNAMLPDASSLKRTFDVQVGAFLKQENALRLRDGLMQKGYSVNILEEPDHERRIRYAVRLGPYGDQSLARRAASNFTQQEKMEAIVRPSGIL